MTTLIVGCSFTVNLKFCDQVDHSKYKVYGSPGSSNQAIAARVLHEVTQQTINHVVVLWSGLNRLSMPVPLDLHRTFDYNYVDVVGNTAWYHSGGMGCSGQSVEAPRVVKQYFDSQYIGASSEYLTDQTLANIIAVQTLLESRGITCDMSFIYDVHDSAPSQHEVSHGKISSTVLYNQVNWAKFTAKQPPWEWACSRQMLDNDGYHPSKSGMISWFKEQLGIDLTQ